MQRLTFSIRVICLTKSYSMKKGLTDALFRTILIYVASSRRPPHELLRPSLAVLGNDDTARQPR
ncbi:hypothetical protein DSM25558_1399 [Agrobacterium sp. DSM 25558]|uniref:Uncharacterized protein n=1 Tax=Agrobacterium rosae TaxID=1972867 RepID=A0A1R3TPE4_9HYPH|nr:hypothetical protein DSM25558_1399 [Agrobacterium sp. DSM 25558]SCX22913.1 hypothetical protein DSM25559_2291 [Agrobacterium rosae]